MRTSFEFSKILFSLDTRNDPHAALLHAEVSAVRSGMGSWLLDVYEYYHKRKGEESIVDPSRMYPGWMYSRALAIYEVDSTEV